MDGSGGRPAVGWIEALRCDCGAVHCHWCGCEVLIPYSGMRRHTRHPRLATRDHLRPRSKGGTRRDGLVIACRLCNGTRGSELDGPWVPWHSRLHGTGHMPGSQRRALARERLPLPAPA